MIGATVGAVGIPLGPTDGEELTGILEGEPGRYGGREGRREGILDG